MKKKVLLITPSNMRDMPYVQSYINILEKENITYEILNWDRKDVEEVSPNTYKSKSKGGRKSLIEYYNYAGFLKKKLKEIEYDTVIIFGLQLTYFLKNYIRKNRLKKKIIIDVRDRHSIINFFNVSKVLNYVELVVISSNEYVKWLNINQNYVVNHNTKISKYVPDNMLNKDLFNGNIIIGTYGIFRDYKINKELINSIPKNSKIKVHFYGEGEKFRAFESEHRGIVSFFGRYDKNDEVNLLHNSTFINVLRYDDSINNKTALPNRLYGAVEQGIPLLAFEGTYLSKLIKQYKLGLVLEDFNDIEIQIDRYIENFQIDEYKNNRELFIRKVIKENRIFELQLLEIINK